MEIRTNEWYDVQLRQPFINRRVLVRLANGRELVLSWNGYYWYDPWTKVKQYFTRESAPKSWYMYEMNRAEYGK